MVGKEGEMNSTGTNKTKNRPPDDISHLKLNCMGRPGCKQWAVRRVVLVEPLSAGMGYYTVNLCLCEECAGLGQETLLGFHRAGKSQGRGGS
jgi:hypothetical protein